ncbi:transcriptional activator RfaH [Candidatus Methylacidiphilum fumarolicum]|uniref:Transcriptional activator RfaH, NusG family n=2 Tax=Candidatus Methylacidiphilum fumarolicum TaxID=591154 RepID=I0K1E6_METFB|nr:transcription termination/antitermination NusG family protein [Candidatus Methylacidiphilum fumarolicum]MBW6414928.1 transcriptional activator RfaH [Candidatus Methylacidiphilum fumarolicum]TFE70379.1 transcriptional regulator [Candidatus Methylacidiphilum fumarolicum]TFE73940.1 transcriptional activator RfaH [Candidatus Methylacidiphilum fumarolicum]TFE74446.1 transcriptional activator RfaH [Candidatus Methylacidiphilum fumarolicum]TFE77892.1 transcriptional regulator [Candidatus Methylaci
MEKQWTNESLWYCLSVHPKKEKFAIENLKKENIEVFFPQILYKKIRSKKSCLVLEPLFPGYLFAKFNLLSKLIFVRSAKGVRTVVHFGSTYPVVPECFITELKTQFGEQGIKMVQEKVNIGSKINIAEGPFKGFSCIVLGFVPARERIKVLLEWLGRTVQTEIKYDDIGVKDSEIFRKNLELD